MQVRAVEQPRFRFVVVLSLVAGLSCGLVTSIPDDAGADATGGDVNGGSASDGTAVGGNMTGTNPAGGNATGGNATGGNATGGNATGGTTSGGGEGGCGGDGGASGDPANCDFTLLSGQTYDGFCLAFNGSQPCAGCNACSFALDGSDPHACAMEGRPILALLACACDPCGGRCEQECDDTLCDLTTPPSVQCETCLIAQCGCSYSECANEA